MATCKVCGGQARRGSGGMANVIRDGKVEVGRVCGACMKRAVALVPAKVEACACGGNASSCSDCVAKEVNRAKRGASDAKALAKKLRDRARAYARARPGPAPDAEAGPGFSEGIEAGLEQAADFLEKGSW